MQVHAFMWRAGSFIRRASPGSNAYSTAHQAPGSQEAPVPFAKGWGWPLCRQQAVLQALALTYRLEPEELCPPHDALQGEEAQ